LQTGYIPSRFADSTKHRETGVMHLGCGQCFLAKQICFETGDEHAWIEGALIDHGLHG
jgi:hypothetical protein